MLARHDTAEALKAELQVSTRDNAVLKSYLRKEIEETERLERELGLCREEVYQKNEEIDRMKDELDRVGFGEDDKGGQLAVARNTISELEKDKQLLASELHKREDELQKLIEHFKTETRSVRKTIRSLDIEKHSTREEKLAYATQLNGATDELATLKPALRQAQEDVAYYKARAENAELKLTRLVAENDQLEERLKSQTDRCTDLTHQLQTLKGQMRIERDGPPNHSTETVRDMNMAERARVRAAIDNDTKGVPERLKDVELSVMRECIEEKNAQLASARRTVGELEDMEMEYRKMASIIPTLPPQYRALFDQSAPVHRRLTPHPSETPSPARLGRLSPNRKAPLQSPHAL